MQCCCCDSARVILCLPAETITTLRCGHGLFVTRCTGIAGTRRYHPKVVRHCLTVYGKPGQEAQGAGSSAMDVDGEGGVWALDERKVGGQQS